MKNILIFILLLLAVFFRIYFAKPDYKIGDYLKISTTYFNEPTVYENSQGLNLFGLYVFLPKYPLVSYGDKLIIEGRVEKSKNGKYLTLKNIKLVSLKENTGSFLKFRQKILDFYQRNLPSRHFFLVSGVSLGSKKGVSEEFWEVLKNSGTAHVVVASGMNVTLVAGFVMALLVGTLSRFNAAIVSIITIWIYVVLAGMGAPVVRAGIMGSLMFASQIFGKVAGGVRILMISAFAMLLVNPLYFFDLGFWLSFSATLSLMVFGRTFEKMFGFIPKLLREGFSTSLAAQIGVAPILYYTFGYINILSPIINALVLWTVSYITILGMIAGVVGICVEPMGKAILFILYPLTSWFILVVEYFG